MPRDDRAGATPRDGTETDIRLDAIELPSLVLVVAAPGAPPRHVVLGVARVVIGSDPACDVVVPDPRMSRRHAEVQRDARGLFLKDLGSKNGTQVDRVEIREAYVEPGHVVTMGGTHLTVERPAGSSRVPLARSPRFGKALGASVPMRALFATLERAAQTDETVLLLGESGTGKELLARAVHDASPRRAGPFVVFDCSAVATSLAEAELFGYLKGAFTGAAAPHPGLFEQAHGGTLFIDELGELPAELQPKLLRALESHEVRRLGAVEWSRVDVRVVAATHRDLRARVAEGAFREDLYYRLAVLEVQVPPLRDRREDIPLLVQHFLDGLKPPRSAADLPPNALELFSSYGWPGNIRELRNTLARLVLFPASAGAGGIGGAEAAPLDPVSQLPQVIGLPLREARDCVVEAFERAYLVAKLGEHGGNVSRTAEAIGVSRQFLHRLLDRYGIDRA